MTAARAASAPLNAPETVFSKTVLSAWFERAVFENTVFETLDTGARGRVVEVEQRRRGFPVAGAAGAGALRRGALPVQARAHAARVHAAGREQGGAPRARAAARAAAAPPDGRRAAQQRARLEARIGELELSLLGEASERAAAHAWRPRDLVVIDNWTTLHKRVPYDVRQRRRRVSGPVAGHNEPAPPPEV